MGAVTSVAETMNGESENFQSKPPCYLRPRKAISRKLRKQLLQKDAFCLFRDSQTGRTCGSRHFLQIDHIKSISAGGTNKLANLQVLCGKHNRYKYEQEVNHRKDG
jgi:5-methylcytosine-specific restriction endonuclease McrA